MTVHEVRASGLEYLGLVTQLLQRARLADPESGLWEAADLQWWWRTPRRSDGVDQVFWVDDDGPVAAVVLTKWQRGWGCDPIVVPGAAVPFAEVWSRALEAIERVAPEQVETLVRDDDHELRDLLVASGFASQDDRGGVTWMDADNRLDVAPLPEGFRLVDRTVATRPHPMRQRSGDAVEGRLGQCSLYDPWLDLAVESDDGTSAGYSLYWFDPVTLVGLVEPMRVEEQYQRRGLAQAMLAAGLERLAERGAERLKVGYSTEPARALYEGMGFRTTTTDTTYSRKRATGSGPARS